MCLQVEDSILLAKLCSGDMISFYPLKCLVSLYYKADRIRSLNTEKQSSQMCHGIALAEIVAYIDERRMKCFKYFTCYQTT